MSDFWGMLPEEWTHRDLRHLQSCLRGHGMQDWCAHISEELESEGWSPVDAAFEAEHRWHTIMGR